MRRRAFPGHGRARGHRPLPLFGLPAAQRRAGLFPADKVRFTVGERKIYQSSPGLGRAFCGQCGTPLTIESEKHDPQNIEFHISTFDKPDAYVRSLHWYHSQRLAWFDVADDLPRYHGLNRDGEEPYRHGAATKGLPGYNFPES